MQYIIKQNNLTSRVDAVTLIAEEFVDQRILLALHDAVLSGYTVCVNNDVGETVHSFQFGETRRNDLPEQGNPDFEGH